jgi:hypothetical protein
MGTCAVFADGFANRCAQLGQLGRAEHHQGDDQDKDEFRQA